MANAIAPREIQIKESLLAQQKTITSLLGDKNKSNKFLATAVKVAQNYNLKSCHPQSIVDACVTVAQLDLDLSPLLSHAYLVPFKAKKDASVASVQLIISERGYRAILSRNGWILKSYIVNEADTFTYKIDGITELVEFEKSLDDEVEAFTYAVAIAQSPNKDLYVCVMNKKQIDKHRQVSSNQGNTPSGVWVDWFDEMAKKTVVKKLAKQLPLGEDIANAVFVDDKTIDSSSDNSSSNVKADIPLKQNINIIDTSGESEEFINGVDFSQTPQEGAEYSAISLKLKDMGLSEKEASDFLKGGNFNKPMLAMLLDDNDMLSAMITKFNDRNGVK